MNSEIGRNKIKGYLEAMCEASFSRRKEYWTRQILLVDRAKCCFVSTSLQYLAGNRCDTNVC